MPVCRIGCISDYVVITVIGSSMGMWALGYGLGQAVAWTRKIRDAV